MGTDETVRMVSDHAKRLAKLESGGEEAKAANMEKDAVVEAILESMKITESQQEHESVTERLEMLKGLIASVVVLMKDPKDSGARNAKSALQLLESWIWDTIDRMEYVKVAKPDLLSNCQMTKELIERGSINDHSALALINTMDAEIDRFLREEVRPIETIRDQLACAGTRIIAERAVRSRNKRASAEPRIQTEAQDSNPEGSKTKK